MRSREAIALGEGENRRLTDIIEAGSTAGWHTFEQSLIKAYEDNQITEETALLYCVNRTQMRQRLDVVLKRRETGPAASSMLKMKSGTERATPVAPPPMAEMKPPGMPEMKPLATATPFQMKP